ncbi:MAG TPA: DUF1828 domain-containing protein [Ferrovibrio sp.]|uniref:DUF1828 domain-containing protein n=1 Tax=Ferrovibrio sp. TaxID=1917215 RepID=UPI002ED510A6
MKEQLCKAFCDELRITEVPLGYAVGTAFRRPDGDAVGFYINYDRKTPGMARLEDDGETMPALEAAGVDFSDGGPRSEAFSQLCAEHSVFHDVDENVLHTQFMAEELLPAAAVKFVAFLLRVQDFLLVTRERVEDTFKRDVVNAVKESFAGRARIETDYVFGEGYKDDPVDIAIIAEGREPLAVFIGTSETRALEALLFYDRVTYKTAMPCRVILIVDSTHTQKVRARTLNRVVNEMPIAAFRDEKLAVMTRLEREVFGRQGTVH